MSKADQVREQLSDIAYWRLMGHTWKSIAELLVQDGLQVSENEIRGYWGRFTKGLHPAQFLLDGALSDDALHQKIAKLEASLIELRTAQKSHIDHISDLETKIAALTAENSRLSHDLLEERDAHSQTSDELARQTKAQDKERRNNESDYNRGRSEALEMLHGDYAAYGQALNEKFDMLKAQAESYSESLATWQTWGENAASLYREDRMDEFEQAMKRLGKWVNVPIPTKKLRPPDQGLSTPKKKGFIQGLVESVKGSSQPSDRPRPPGSAPKRGNTSHQSRGKK